MKILNSIKYVALLLLVLGILLFSVITGAIIEKFNLYPITTQLSLFLESTGLSKLRSQVKGSVTGADQIQEKIISSNYYDLILKKHLRPTYEDYGGIDILNSQLFYVDKKGYGWVQNDGEFNQVITSPLDLNEESFIESFGAYSALSFGVKDILIVANSENSASTLFVSAVNFNKDQKCYFLSIFMTEISAYSNQTTEWSNIFDSEPCLDRHTNNTFAGTSAGGRLVYGDNNIFLSTGDFYFDGVNEIDLTAAPGSHYGKIIKISLNTMGVEIFAKGLRNPQGLFLDKDGIFETEHAPQGGDELNFIGFDQSLKDYGWPNASFGVDYGTKIWPLDPQNKNFKAGDFVAPIMSWIPSIGISNLIRFYSDDGLSRWNGDLLITSLRDKSIYRIKLDGMRPILIERIEVGFRIRDLIQFNNKIYIQAAGSKDIWELKEKT